MPKITVFTPRAFPISVPDIEVIAVQPWSLKAVQRMMPKASGDYLLLSAKGLSDAACSSLIKIAGKNNNTDLIGLHHSLPSRLSPKEIFSRLFLEARFPLFGEPFFLYKKSLLSSLPLPENDVFFDFDFYLSLEAARRAQTYARGLCPLPALSNPEAPYMHPEYLPSVRALRGLITKFCAAHSVPAAENINYFYDKSIRDFINFCPLSFLKEHWDQICAAFGIAYVFDTLSRYVPAELMPYLRTPKPPAIRKIKTIAIIIQFFRTGGAERVSSILAKMFAAHGYKIVIFTNESPGPQDYPYSCPRVVLRGGRYYQDLTEALAVHQVDLVIIQDHAWDTTCQNLLYFNTRKDIVTVLCHHSSPVFECTELSLQLQDLNRGTFPMADVFVCLSQANQIFFAQRFRTNTLYIPNPLTVDPQDTGVSPLNEPNVVFIGRDHSLKGFPLLLEAAALIAQSCPNFKLYFVGRIDAEKYSSYIIKHKLQNNIVFTRETNNVGQYLAQASVHIFPSKTEGWGMVWTEAKAYGVPTVALRMDYNELARSKGCIIVEQNNAKAMADAVVKLLSDKQLRVQMGEQARASLASFTTGRALSLWEGLFSAAEAGTIAEYCNQKKDTSLVSAEIMSSIDAAIADTVKQKMISPEVERYLLPGGIPFMRKFLSFFKRLLRFMINRVIIPQGSRRRNFIKKMYSKLGDIFK